MGTVTKQVFEEIIKLKLQTLDNVAKHISADEHQEARCEERAYEVLDKLTTKLAAINPSMAALHEVIEDEITSCAADHLPTVKIAVQNCLNKLSTV